MGFVSGVVTGVALAAGAAAWYMSRSGERFRDQYRVERRLGELGDQMETRTRDMQTSVNAQLAEIRSREDAGRGNGTGAGTALDPDKASAAEAAAQMEAAVSDDDSPTRRMRKAAKEATAQ